MKIVYSQTLCNNSHLNIIQVNMPPWKITNTLKNVYSSIAGNDKTWTLKINVK